MPSVLVPLAEGFEEIEAITLIDILRRADFDVVTASLGDKAVTAAHGVSVLADCTLDEALTRDYDMVVLPGGLPGADHLDNDARIHQILKKTADSGRFVGRSARPRRSGQRPAARRKESHQLSRIRRQDEPAQHDLYRQRRGKGRQGPDLARAGNGDGLRPGHYRGA